MKGFLQRRGDAWQLRVYLGADTVTGKQRYASRTVRGGKRDAQRALAEFVTEAQRGRLATTGATVGDLLESWFDQAKGNFSPKTVRETRGFMDRNLIPALGHVPLSRLRASDLDHYYLGLVGGRGGCCGSLKFPTVDHRNSPGVERGGELA